jgi:hypothetical protein
MEQICPFIIRVTELCLSTETANVMTVPSLYVLQSYAWALKQRML